nr:MAG TPA: hypothetical protein [Bacteriophage sp.]
MSWRYFVLFAGGFGGFPSRRGALKRSRRFPGAAVLEFEKL